MAHFTRQEIEEIRMQLAQQGMKDTDFEETDKFVGDDFFVIVQDGVNKKIRGHTFRSDYNEIAEQDHLRAMEDRQTANSDHNRAENDHSRALTDSGRASQDHSRAESDNSRALEDHSVAESDHRRAVEDHATADNDHTASADATLAATEAAHVATAAAEAATSLQNSLESGEVVPALAGDIASWKGNNSPVEDTWSDVIRPTAGSVSIVTAAGGKIKSIIAKSLIFSATAMRAEGFNRLHYATALGAGYYFLVPALPFGTFGTAIEPNGILFTNSAGHNLRPTVRFKKLTDGVPTSLTDGTACTYVDSNIYRFYTCSEPGYMIVSGITFADTCAHIAWSSRYDEFVSPTASSDAGTVVTLTALINAVHSYGEIINLGGKAEGFLWTDDSHYTWYRYNDRITPTWSTVANEDGTYTHIATISTMLSDGAAVLADGTPLAVEGTTVSYTDDSADTVTGYVYFNLATPATGTGTASRNAAMEDWGVEAVIGSIGEAYITTMYYRGVADTVRAWVAGEMDGAFAVIAQLFADADRRMAAMEGRLADGMLSLTVDNLTVNNSLTRYDNSGNHILTGEGAPAVMADYESQLYKDTASGDWYFATGTTAVSQWRKITLQ